MLLDQESNEDCHDNMQHKSQDASFQNTGQLLVPVKSNDEKE